MGNCSSNHQDNIMKTSTIEETKIKDCDQTFILFGKSNSGKSALGNLLMGNNANTYFSTHSQLDPSGHTKKMQSGEAEIDARIVYGEGYTGHNRVKIQVIDQPGCNDKDHFIFSNQCLEATKSKMSAIFLFVINLTASYFSQEEFDSFMKFARILADNQYCVFSNAILVFTHADILENLKKCELEEIVHQKLQQENHGYIQGVLEFVEKGYILINAVNHEETNRHNILKNIFQLTRPNLNVYIEGNYSFKERELKQFFGDEKNAVAIIISSEEYNIEYHFNPKINSIHRCDSLKGEIINAFNKLNIISHGLTAIVILINLEQIISKELFYQIIDLPNTYNLGYKSEDKFWDYACIVFKVREDSKEYVKQEIDVNLRLKYLSRKVQSRYCWITDKTSPEECHERLGNLVKEVASYNKWKTYTDGATVTEMGDKIRNYFEHKYSNNCEVVPNEQGIERSPRVGRFEDILLSINNSFWDKDVGISTQIGHFIWKNINTDIAKKFKTRYPLSTVSRIAIETYLDFCILKY